MHKTQENVLINRDLLSNLVHETSFLVAQARIGGKTEPECRMVCGLLAQVTAVMGKAAIRSDSGTPGIECPICHQVVDDADYWDGDRCLKCRLDGIGRPDLANILSKPGCKPDLFILGNVREWTNATSRPIPRPPDSYLEEMYEARTELSDSEMT